MLNFIRERFAKIQGKTTGITSAFINTTGSVCTNKCYMCPLRTFTGKNVKMPLETFQKAISQLKELDFSGELHLYAQNEPFLDKGLFEKIDYAHRQIPNAKITLISNFTVLDDEKIKKLVTAPLTYFSCSIYALKCENYAQICGRDNFKLSFINQVKFMKEYAKNPQYSFALYLMNDQHNQEDIEFCKHFIFNIAPVRRADFYETFSFFNTNHAPKKHNRGYINHCIYDRFQIMNDGDVSLCSIDACSDMHVGNLKETTLKKLLNAPQCVELRKRMLEDKREDAYCRWCEFGRFENKLLYFLPIPQKLRAFLNKKFSSSFKSEHTCLDFSAEEIKQKLARFNEIFKDDEEDKWFDVLDDLRNEFYGNKTELCLKQD